MDTWKRPFLKRLKWRELMGYQWPHKPYDAICHMSFLVLFPSPSLMWFIDLTWFNHPFWGELGNWGYMPLSPCHVARFILRSWVMLLLISIIISGRVVPPPPLAAAQVPHMFPQLFWDRLWQACGSSWHRQKGPKMPKPQEKITLRREHGPHGANQGLQHP